MLGRYTFAVREQRPKAESLGLADARRHRRSPRLHAALDYALAGALARHGVDVRLLTSRFRFGAVPEADGFTVDDSLYRVSTG